MKRMRGAVIVTVLMVAGCSGPRAAPPSAVRDPASPEAAGGPMPVLSGVLDAPSTSSAAALATTTAPAAEAAYVCPMHPQVTAAGPGQCPICHMALVPRPGNGTGGEQ